MVNIDSQEGQVCVPSAIVDEFHSLYAVFYVLYTYVGNSG